MIDREAAARAIETRAGICRALSNKYGESDGNAGVTEGLLQAAAIILALPDRPDRYRRRNVMTTREAIARAIEARADELDRDPGPYLRVDQVQLSAGLRWAARIAREVGDDTDSGDR